MGATIDKGTIQWTYMTTTYQREGITLRQSFYTLSFAGFLQVTSLSDSMIGAYNVSLILIGRRPGSALHRRIVVP